jgi:hypothetical protein
MFVYVLLAPSVSHVGAGRRAQLALGGGSEISALGDEDNESAPSDVTLQHASSWSTRGRGWLLSHIDWAARTRLTHQATPVASLPPSRSRGGVFNAPEWSEWLTEVDDLSLAGARHNGPTFAEKPRRPIPLRTCACRSVGCE